MTLRAVQSRQTFRSGDLGIVNGSGRATRPPAGSDGSTRIAAAAGRHAASSVAPPIAATVAAHSIGLPALTPKASVTSARDNNQANPAPRVRPTAATLIPSTSTSRRI